MNHRYSFVAMLLSLPLGASALELREQPVHSLILLPSPAPAAPVEAAEGRPTTPRLRDSLRQPSNPDGESGYKPYRLTPEARLRLREQLRGGAEQSAHNR
jgi:hypothetical protein